MYCVMGGDVEVEIPRTAVPVRARGILAMKKTTKKAAPNGETANSTRRPLSNKKVKSGRGTKFELFPTLGRENVYNELCTFDHDTKFSVSNRFADCIKNAREARTRNEYHFNENSLKIVELLGITRSHPDSLGQIVLDYLTKLEARAAILETVGGIDSAPAFDLHRLEPFAGSMNETASELIRSCGVLYMELTRHLESLSTMRETKEHTALFRNCVEQRLHASRNLMALHEFTKHVNGAGSDETCVSFPDLQRKLHVASPFVITKTLLVEIPQRGPEFTQDDLAQRTTVTNRLELYRETMTARNRHMIYRPPDTERLFPCVIQRNTIMALMTATSTLQNHNIDFDVTDVVDVASKYDALCSRKSDISTKHRKPANRKHRSNATKGERAATAPPVTHRDKAEDERMEWRRLLCSTDD